MLDNWDPRVVDGVAAAGRVLTPADLVNRGSIDAILGMVAATTDGRIVNAADGQIRATSAGITVSSAAGETFHVTNHGDIRMSSNSAAILTSAGDDRVINDGRVEGYIYLGAGNDRFDTRGGIATSSIFGGADDDVLLTDRASYTLRENSGDGTADTVRSTVSYVLSDNVERLYLLGNKDIDGKGTSLADRLHGNSGNNDLKGLGGADYLYGHKGNDRLFGGGDADWFYFSTGDGDDKVMDYVDGSDQLHLEGWNAITSLADLKNNHATNQGANLLIEAGGDSLLVLGISKADLDAGDVFF